MSGPCILVSMTVEFEPPRFPDDPDEITDVEAIAEMARVRNYRQTKNINFPRFVRALNQAGYKITLEDYKKAETRPQTCIDFVRDGMLIYAYKVLNATRVRGSVQGEHTAHAMTVIRAYRVAKGYEFVDMAEMLTDHNIPTSTAEYRTAEQGITKVVPFEVIAECVAFLGVPHSEVFR